MNVTVSILTAATKRPRTTKPSDDQALMGCGVSDAMEQSVPLPGPSVRGDTIPTYSTFAGKRGSLLRVDVNSGAEPAVGVNLELNIDDSIVRRRGGCYFYDSMNVTLCLRGKVGLYKFNAVGQFWEKDAAVNPWEEEVNPSFWKIDDDESHTIDLLELMAAVEITSNSSHEFETLSDIFQRADLNDDLAIDEDEYTSLSSKVSTTNVTSSSTWAALATSPCCDYEGTGAPCGDKILRLPWMDYYGSESKVKILLGDGVFSNKPGFPLTDRPAFKSVDDVLASRAVGSMPTPMKLRSGWRQLCPSQIGDEPCEGNVASLDWCADITFVLHAYLNECNGLMFASLCDSQYVYIYAVLMNACLYGSL
jgi:hypothetical protein